MLVLISSSSSKSLAKWQGLFVVARRVVDLDYEVKRTDSGDSCQIYHLNLLKHWNEVTSVELAVAVSEEEDLGPMQLSKLICSHWLRGEITYRRCSLSI